MSKSYFPIILIFITVTERDSFLKQDVYFRFLNELLKQIYANSIWVHALMA